MTARPTRSPTLIVLAATLVLGLAGGKAALALDEGIDYRTVTEPMRAEAGDGVELLELFWYGCPHCYQLEPQLNDWLARQSVDIDFQRVPAAASPRWVPHAKAYYAAEQLGVLDKLHEPLFKALHEQRRRILTDEQLIAFAAEQGIDEDEFRAAYNSFPVDMKVRRSAELVRRYAIDGVPAIVVDGKYVTSATQTGSTATMFDVLEALVTQEADADAQPADAAEAPESDDAS